jgi:hypothetical protein
MQLPAHGDAFDGRDKAPVGLSRQDRARFDCAPIDMDDAGAALTGVAADMRTRQIEIIAQKMDKERAVFDIDRNRLTVHGQFGHSIFLPQPSLTQDTYISNSQA